MEEELEQITSILDQYQSRKLFSLELRRELIGQEASYDTSQELDDDGDRPGNIKQMEVDAKILRRLDFDLISYEAYLSAVQFNWVEAAAKERFITSTVLDENGLNCSYDEIQKLCFHILFPPSKVKPIRDMRSCSKYYRRRLNKMKRR